MRLHEVARLLLEEWLQRDTERSWLFEEPCIFNWVSHVPEEDDDGHDYYELELYDVSPRLADLRDYLRRKFEHTCWLAMARISGRNGRF